MTRIIFSLVAFIILSVIRATYSTAHTCTNDSSLSFIEFMIRYDTWPARPADFDGISNLKEDILRYGGIIDKCDVHTFDDGMRGIIAT